ncbi:hypothetical protein WJX79_005401 [Trebouxia sp. C0005]|nr:MAG: hypothetical protein FRX49_09992 [Trebouxia sp. A1-2]
MLGVSYFELLLIVGLGSVVLGPKDLPRVARYAGQATGRAAAYLTMARSKFARFSEEAQLDKLHAEMQQSMQQLSAIQSELRGNINFMNPGPVAQRALRMQRPASTDEDSPASSSAGFDPAQYQHWTSQAHQSSSKTHPPAASSFAASAADTAAAMSMSLRQTSDELQSHASQVSSEQLRPLPISAVSLGKAPLRSDSVATGSDILLDALREEEVAAHAQRFLETEQGQAILKSPGTVSNG